MDFLHKVTSTLIRENQAVCVEDLNVKGLAANRCLSRAISDIGFAEFGHCGVEIDRDLNAAINIHTAGLAEIHACGQDGAGRGESRDETGLDEAGTKPRANSRSLTN